MEVYALKDLWLGRPIITYDVFDGKIVQVAVKRGRRIKLSYCEKALDLHLYKREEELLRVALTPIDYQVHWIF
jgi:hypothetical protein